ncbi:MAG: hypothetical protein ACOVQR_05670 [Flavobacterium sp.]|jgi:hypothetical protein|uniref:hypothetical protein n=1 Tax=Flavobacterium sp. TaxID=239 RepID=UPI003BA703A1
MKKYFLLIFFTTLNIYSQNVSEYFGILKLNDSSLITYKLYLKEERGIISGFSLTDIGGEHETKSLIKGNYDAKTNLLSFSEYDIVYTKSLITKYDFCFVHFKGKLSKFDGGKGIKGKFLGLYKDGTKCINGEINLANFEKVKSKTTKIDKKIQKTNRIDKETKEKISMKKMMDSLNLNILKEDKNLNIFTSFGKVEIKINDNGIEDGDKITIYHNKMKVLENYTVTKSIKTITLNLKNGENLVEIEALNEGNIKPNTATITIKDEKNEIKTISKLNKSKRTKITFIKR